MFEATIATRSMTTRSRSSRCPCSASRPTRSSAPSAFTRTSRASGAARGSRSPASIRRIGAIGATLIRLAVSSAHAMGCRTFLAHVQAQNAPLFHQMHWETMAEVELHGRPHHEDARRPRLLPAVPRAGDRLRRAEEGGLTWTRRLSTRLPQRSEARVRRSPPRPTSASSRRDLGSAQRARSRSATIARRSPTATAIFSSPPKASSAHSSTPIPGSPAGAA